jgi:hypothetical protein
MHFNAESFKTAIAIKKRMNDIKEGRAEDIYGWMFKV